MLKAQWVAGVFMSSGWCAHQFAMLCRLKPHRTLNTVLSIIYFHSCGTTIAADGNFIFTWSYTRTWQNSKIRQDWNLLNSWPTLLFFQGDLTLVWALKLCCPQRAERATVWKFCKIFKTLSTLAQLHFMWELQNTLWPTFAFILSILHPLT